MTEAGVHVLDRFYDGLSRGDVTAVTACCTADVRIWHNFDRVAQDLDTAARAWAGFIAACPERTVAGVRRQSTPEGCVQQFIMTIGTADGAVRARPICVVVKIEDGLIARLDEYVDLASSFAPEGTLTHTCDIAAT